MSVSEATTSRAAGPQKRTAVFAIAGFVLAGGVFVWVHLHNYWQFVAPILERAPEGTPMAGKSLGKELLGYGLITCAAYAGFALAGIAIAYKTRDRILWALPALLFVLSPLPAMFVLNDRPALRGIVDVFDRAGALSATPVTRFALLDLLLVLAPGALVALRVAPLRRRADGHVRLAFVLCALLGLLLYMRQRSAASGMFDVNVSAHLILGVLFVIGASLGIRRPWFPAVHVAVAFLLSAETVYTLVEWINPALMSGFPAPTILGWAGKAMLPPLAAIGIGALSDPLARYFRRRRAKLRRVAPQPA